MKDENSGKTKTILFNILMTILCCSLIAGFFIGIIVTDRKNRNYWTENPPTLNEIEEQLEYIFMSCSLYVYDNEQEEDEMYYWVEDYENKNYYIVRYKLKKIEFGYRWELDNYIQCFSKRT